MKEAGALRSRPLPCEASWALRLILSKPKAALLLAVVRIVLLDHT